MFAIAKTQAAAGLEAVERDTPAGPGVGEVSVRVTHAGICGTDLHIYNWDKWASSRIKPPLITGHEFVGLITAVGEGVTHFEVGQRVSAESHMVCGVCRQCRTGLAHLCVNTEIIGVDVDGAFTESLNVPAANLWPVHKDVPDHHAAIFDPVGNAMHTVASCPMRGKHVLVSGAGAIGLISIPICKAFGALQITVIEPNAERRKLALELGADVALHPSDDADQIQKLKNKSTCPQTVLEMSGHPAAIQTALDVIDMGGTIAFLGIPNDAVPVNIAEQVVFKGLTMKGITGREIFKTWYQVEAFMRTHPEAMDKIISHILPAGDFQQGFDLFAKGEASKVVLKFS